MDSDRNLLFGVLALQRKAISKEHFADACALWFARKSGSLANILLERGWIEENERAAIECLVEGKMNLQDANGHVTQVEPATDLSRRSPSQAVEAQYASTIVAASSRNGDQDHVPESIVRTERHYKLTKLHAEGGIGRIWLARDDSLGRDVALKELLPGRVGNQALWSRFVNEARITSQLEHPGVVPIYEVGTQPSSNLPFYTMRFVRGRTLQEAINTFHRHRQYDQAGPLQFNELLMAFVGVCNAIAYAHSRGVIHRDLKPPNIVLGDFGEVMVLDWGLAKLIDQPDLPATASLELDGSADQTLAGEVLGTPCYMAPEQASAQRELEDQRTDIYGLGAVLYELLAGKPPFASSKSSEVLQKVRSETPLRPSQIESRTPPVLEAICLKAMAKNRADRYRSAKDLAVDVQHWLADEPTSASNEPLAARAGRWMRHHKTWMAAAAALVITATIASTTGLVLISRKNVEIDTKRAEAVLAREQEFEQRQHADAAFRKAREAVDTLVTRVGDERLRHIPRMEKARRELLEKAVAFNKGFLEQRGDDPTIRLELALTQGRLGTIYQQLGKNAEAVKAERDASERLQALTAEFATEPLYRRELANSQERLARLRVPPNEEESKAVQTALDLRTQLVGEVPGQGEYQKDLADSLMLKAEDHARYGKLTESIISLQQAYTYLEKLVTSEPANMSYLSGLANSQQKLGTTFDEIGKRDVGENWLRESINSWKKLGLREPDRTDHLENLATTERRLAISLTRMGRTQDAGPFFEASLSEHEKLAADFPLFPDYRRDVADSCVDLGVFYAQQGRLDKAEPPLRRSIEIYEQLTKDFPDHESYRRNLAYGLNNLGKMTSDLGRPKEAEQLLRRSLQHRQTNYSHENTSAELAWDLGQGYLDLGQFLSRNGAYVEAESMLKQAIAMCRQAADGGKNPDYRHKLALSQYQLADMCSRLDRVQEAEALLVQAENYWQNLVKEQPKVVAYRRYLAKSFDLHGRLHFDLDQMSEALEGYRSGFTLWETLVKNQPNFEEFRDGRSECQEMIGKIHRQQKQLAEAEKLFREVLATRQKLVDGNAKNLRQQRLLAKANLNLAGVLVETGRSRDAAQLADAADKIAHQLDATDYHNLYLLAEVEGTRALLIPATGTAKELPDQRKQHGDQAMAALNQAVARGFQHAAGLRHNRNFDTLLERQDFKRLYIKIHEKEATAAKPADAKDVR